MPPVIATLLYDLANAVRAGDAYQAHLLAQDLRRCIASDATIPDSVEQRIRELLTNLRVSEEVDVLAAALESYRTMLLSFLLSLAVKWL